MVTVLGDCGKVFIIFYNSTPELVIISQLNQRMVALVLQSFLFTDIQV